MCIFLYHEKQRNGTFSEFQTAARLKKNLILKITKYHCHPNKLEFNNKTPSQVFNKTHVQKKS